MLLLSALSEIFAKKNIGPVAYVGGAMQGSSNSLTLFFPPPMRQLLQESDCQSGKLSSRNLLLITMFTIPNLSVGANNQTASSWVHQKTLAGSSFLRFQAGYINYC